DALPISTHATASDAAPADAAPESPHREMHVARWGLLPHWAKHRSTGAKMINARVETVAAKFAVPLRTRRCLVPADGYFEWQRQGAEAPKRPFFIHAADSAPLGLAGLYSWWRNPAARGEPAPWLLTCTILTTAAAGPMTELHERVPVVLAPETVGPWLDRSVTGAAEALALLGAPAPPLAWHEVSTQVNAVRNNSPALVEPVG
ncbi:MAG: SOS response-associated peptidase, partial [Georgenia sp.]